MQQLEQIEARRKALLLRIEDGKAAEAELARLDAWLKAGEEFLLPPAADLTKFQAATSRNREAIEKLNAGIFRTPRTQVANSLSVVAEKVLRENGPTHIDTLLRLMRAAGWVSTGDDKLDWRNIYNSLSRSNKFIRTGKGIFELASEEGAQK